MTDDRQSGQEPKIWARLDRLARAAFKYWALFGGFILVGLVLMTEASAISNLLFNRPFAGDYEVVKHGVAIAAFAFLPYCQITYGNVTVDVFTERMSERVKAAMVLASSLIAAAIAALLFSRMRLGMQDYITYREVMTSLPIPLWTAFPPALVSLALWFVASLMTAGEGLRGMRQGTPIVSQRVG